ncbi:hypothetical protein [Pseudobutyrivibrio sp.]
MSKTVTGEMNMNLHIATDLNMMAVELRGMATIMMDDGNNSCAMRLETMAERLDTISDNIVNEIVEIETEIEDDMEDDYDDIECRNTVGQKHCGNACDGCGKS